MSIFETWRQGFQWRKFQDKIGEPPWEYDFLLNLDESEYPKYLAKIFNYRTGEKLPLRSLAPCGRGLGRGVVIDKNKCKTFNQKIQWIKLHGITPLMRKCTDKFAVRDYVKEKIGEDYLKPVLQICHAFDEINFSSLPDSFVMKCTHGCKWQYIIKDKTDYINTPVFIDITKRQLTGWLEQEYSVFEGFEMQYQVAAWKFSCLAAGKCGGLNDNEVQNCKKSNYIMPKILIEPLLREDINRPGVEVEVYCFEGIPKYYVKVCYGTRREICYYDENFEFCDLILHPDGGNLMIKEPADELLKKAGELSKELSKDFNFVRVDWLVYKNKLYFNELTFTPYSGLIAFDKKWNEKLGSLIKL